MRTGDGNNGYLLLKAMGLAEEAGGSEEEQMCEEMFKKEKALMALIGGLLLRSPLATAS